MFRRSSIDSECLLHRGGALGAIALLLLTSLAVASPAAAGSGFTDIDDSPFKDSIEWLVDQGITSGCSVDPPKFCPTAKVTREQMAIFLDRALELPDETDPHPFTDIGTRSATAQQAIQNLWGSGIAAGCTATKFCPTANVTREQMAIFLDRGLPLPDEPDPHPFTDIGTRSAVAQDAIRNLWGAGITGGCTATRYCPLGLVTRGQMAAFLHRALGEPDGNEAPVLQAISGKAVAERASLDVAISATDPDGDTLTITAAVWPDAPWATLVGSGSSRTLQLRPNTNSAGVYDVTVTATDPDGLTDTVTFALTVNRTPPYGGTEGFFAITKSAGISANSTASDSFRLTNRSGNGAEITSVSIDISTTLLPNLVFDPAGVIHVGVGKCFTADGGAATTGLVTDGSGSGAASCVAPYADPRDGGYEVLNLAFDDFGPGESFTFSADVDPLSLDGSNTNQATDFISGLEMSGTTVSITFSNGDIRTVQTFRTIDSQGGSQNSATGEATLAQPTISAIGFPDNQATVTDPEQVIRVEGPVGATVILLQVEAGMYQQTGPVGEYEANTALLLAEFIEEIPDAGFLDIPVTVQRFADGGGYNHFVAVTSTGDRRTTSLNSDVIVLKLAD